MLSKKSLAYIYKKPIVSRKADDGVTDKDSEN